MRGVERGVGRVLLGHRDLARVADARVLHPRDLEIEQAADLVVAGHARDHLLDKLVTADLLAKGLALARVLHRGVEARPYRAGRSGGHRVAAVVEAAHGDLESIALIADPVRLRDLEIGHEDRADVTRADAEAG